MQQKVSIAGMALDQESHTTIIILKLDKNELMIPIWVGLLEAVSIASAMGKVDTNRPLTHDLFENFVKLRQMDVAKIEIYDLIDNTYYARIHFLAMEETFSMEARPSDAIALALRFNAPMYVNDSVIAMSKKQTGPSYVMDKSEEGMKWADYLENLSTEAFGDYKV